MFKKFGQRVFFGPRASNVIDVSEGVYIFVHLSHCLFVKLVTSSYHQFYLWSRPPNVRSVRK